MEEWKFELRSRTCKGETVDVSSKRRRFQTKNVDGFYQLRRFVASTVEAENFTLETSTVLFQNVDGFPNRRRFAQNVDGLWRQRGAENSR